jgi:tetratricopeptide (TPR) repeat protein
MFASGRSSEPSRQLRHILEEPAQPLLPSRLPYIDQGIHVHIGVTGMAKDHTAELDAVERAPNPTHIIGESCRRNDSVLDDLHGRDRRIELRENWTCGMSKRPKSLFGFRLEPEHHTRSAGRKKSALQRRRDLAARAEKFGKQGDAAARQGALTRAVAELNRALEIYPQYARALHSLALAHHSLGDTATARGYFEKAAELDATYQLNLGRLYKQQGDRARARACFEAFLAAKGASPEYAQMLPQVRQELASVQ